jgi:hypothetical protein
LAKADFALADDCMFMLPSSLPCQRIVDAMVLRTSGAKVCAAIGARPVVIVSRRGFTTCRRCRDRCQHCKRSHVVSASSNRVPRIGAYALVFNGIEATIPNAARSAAFRCVAGDLLQHSQTYAVATDARMMCRYWHASGGGAWATVRPNRPRRCGPFARVGQRGVRYLFRRLAASSRSVRSVY